MSEMTATRMWGPAWRLATLTGCAAAWFLAAALLWRTEVPGGLQLPVVEAGEVMSGPELARASQYEHSQRLVVLGAWAASLAWLIVFAWLGRRLLPLGGRYRAGAALAFVGLTGVWVVLVPFQLLAQRQRRRYGLSDQGYLERLLDPWLFLVGEVVLACLAVVAAMWLARRLGRRWWLAGGPLLGGLGAVVVLAQPLLLSPRLDPLRDRPVLAARIETVARDLGVGRVEVEVRKASVRTRAANAEAIGIGPTRRVILWDTLFQRGFTTEEIVFVSAHELAHVARSHVWKGLGWLALLSLPIAFAIARVTRARGGMAEPAAVPLALLAVTAIQLVLIPGLNVLSRRYEAEADWVALRATRQPVAAERLYGRFAATSLSEPDRRTWAHVLFGTHPRTVDRVAMSRAWAARQRP